MIPKNSALTLSVLPFSKRDDVVITAIPEFSDQLLTDVRIILETKNVKPISVSRDNIISPNYRFYDSRPKPNSKLQLP